jgi:hypothetical protein
MTARVLFCGICLIGLHAGGGMAQTPSSRADTPVADKPAAVDGTQPTPPAIPEIIRDRDDSVPQPKAIKDPGSALTPPTVNLQFLRAIRLDRMGHDMRVARSRDLH